MTRLGSPPNPRGASFRMWQCVYVTIRNNTYAGYVFGDAGGEKYKVAIPREGYSKKVHSSHLREKPCSEYLKQKIARHKRMLGQSQL